MYAIANKKRNRFVKNIRRDISSLNADRIIVSSDKFIVFEEQIDARVYMIVNRIPENRFEIVELEITIK